MDQVQQRQSLKASQCINPIQGPDVILSPITT